MAFLHPSQFPPPVYTWGKSLLCTAPRFWFSGHHVANVHWSEVQLGQSWNIKSKNISLIALEPSIALLLTTCIIATCLQYDPNHDKNIACWDVSGSMWHGTLPGNWFVYPVIISWCLIPTLCCWESIVLCQKQVYLKLMIVNYM